jgi:hypothetical protein
LAKQPFFQPLKAEREEMAKVAREREIIERRQNARERRRQFMLEDSLLREHNLTNQPGWGNIKPGQRRKFGGQSRRSV